MVNLQDFVTEALVQVVEGVKAAQGRVSDGGGMINPEGARHPNITSEHLMWEQGNAASKTQRAQVVEFDIAVTAAEGGDIKGGIAVVTGMFNLGMKSGLDAGQSTVSRVRFSVPVFLPQQQVK